MLLEKAALILEGYDRVNVIFVYDRTLFLRLVYRKRSIFLCMLALESPRAWQPWEWRMKWPMPLFQIQPLIAFQIAVLPFPPWVFPLNTIGESEAVAFSDAFHSPHKHLSNLNAIWSFHQKPLIFMKVELVSLFEIEWSERNRKKTHSICEITNVCQVLLVFFVCVCQFVNEINVHPWLHKSRYHAVENTKTRGKFH